MMIFAMNKGLSSVMNLLQYQAFRGSSESFLLCWRAGKQGIKLRHGNLACSSLHHTPDNTPHHMTQQPVCSDVVIQPLTVIYGLPPALCHRTNGGLHLMCWRYADVDKVMCGAHSFCSLFQNIRVRLQISEPNIVSAESLLPCSNMVGVASARGIKPGMEMICTGLNIANDNISWQKSF